MERKISITIIITFIFSMLVLSGCLSFLADKKPIYEREDSEEDGIVVTIDGVEYKTYPELKWMDQRAVPEAFGYAGNKKYTLHYCKDDPDRNFIFVWDKDFQPLGEFHYVLLYRTDIEIPPPSAESVDKIYFQDINFRPDEEIRKHRFISDKETIEALFDELEANEDTWIESSDSMVKYLYSLSCSSEQVPGARYDIYFNHKDGVLVCGNKIHGFVEVSVELLEMLAGYEIDLEWLLEYKSD